MALAAAKDKRSHAFKDAIELLLDVLRHVDNSGNIYDPDNALAAMLEALGNMHTDDAEVRAPCLNQHGMRSPSALPHVFRWMLAGLTQMSRMAHADSCAAYTGIRSLHVASAIPVRYLAAIACAGILCAVRKSVGSKCSSNVLYTEV